jgi:hypothetical protein
MGGGGKRFILKLRNGYFGTTPPNVKASTPSWSALRVFIGNKNKIDLV